MFKTDDELSEPFGVLLGDALLLAHEEGTLHFLGDHHRYLCHLIKVAKSESFCLQEIFDSLNVSAIFGL